MEGREREREAGEGGRPRRGETRGAQLPRPLRLTLPGVVPRSRLGAGSLQVWQVP